MEKEYVTFIFGNSPDIRKAAEGPHLLVDLPADAGEAERLALLDAFEASGFKYMARVETETPA